MKKIIPYIMLCIFFLTSCAGKEKEPLRTEKELIDKLPEYSIDESDMSDVYDSFIKAYNENGRLHMLCSKIDEKADVFEISLADGKTIKNFSVKGDHVFSPYNYVNGEFYSKGCKYLNDGDTVSSYKEEYRLDLVLDTAQNDEKIYSLCLLENKRYCILETDFRSDDIHCVYLDEVIDHDSETLFFSCIACDDKNIFISAFDTNVSGNSKSYQPYIYILDTEYKLNDVLTDIDTDMPEFLVSNEDRTLLIGKYDSVEDMTYASVVDISKKRSEYYVDIKGRCSFFAGKDKHSMYYCDGIKNIYKIDTQTMDTKLLYDISKIEKLDDEELHVISCDEDKLVYIKVFNGEVYHTFSLDNSGRSESEDNLNNFYTTVNNDDGLEYIINYTQTEKIIPENTHSVYSSVYRTGDMFYIYDDGRIFAYGTDGKLGNKLITGEKKIIGIFSDQNKNFISYSEKNNYYIAETDGDKIKNEFDMSSKLPENVSGELRVFSGDEFYTAYAVFHGILYGINYEGRDVVPLIDIAGYSIDADAVISNGENFYIVYKNKLYTFSQSGNKEQTANEQEKKVITVSVSFNNETDLLKPFADKFCSMHNVDIRIEPMTFYTDTSEYSITEDYRKNNMPDIVFGSGDGLLSELNDLERRGAFYDLNGFIDGDNGLDDENVLMNIVRAYSCNGKQYTLPLDFSLNTVMTRYDLIKDISYGWNYDDFISFLSETHEFFVFNNIKKDDIITELSLSSNRDLIDRQNNISYFDTDKFISLIKAIDKYGADPDTEDIELFYSGNYIFQTNKYIDGSMVSKYKSADELRHSIKGYPSDSGNYTYADKASIVNISASSENKELCWEFIKMILLDEYDMGYSKNNGNKFSVSRKHYDKVLNSIERTSGRETADELRKIVSSVDEPMQRDERVEKIIYDELLIFFGGGQSAEESAENIQSKVKLYLAEIE